jgi:hypothetical protein
MFGKVRSKSTQKLSEPATLLSKKIVNISKILKYNIKILTLLYLLIVEI